MQKQESVTSRDGSKLLASDVLSRHRGDLHDDNGTTGHGESTSGAGGLRAKGERQPALPGRASRADTQGTTSACARWILATTSPSFLVGGLTVIGVAGWGLRYHGPYEDVIPAGALNTIVAAGFAIAVAATVGMYGAVSKSKRLLLWFATLAVVIMGVEVIGASLAASWVSRNGNEYLNALANNSSVTGRTADLDAALDEAVSVCCPVAQAGTSWRDVAECEFLAVAGVTPASGCAYAGGSATELKTAVVTFVLDDLVNPLTALTFVLLVPQVIAAVATCWLVSKLRQRDSLIPDDSDPTLPPIPDLAIEPTEFPWVYCLVFPANEHEADGAGRVPAKAIIERLRAAGLEVGMRESQDTGELFCLVTANRKRLEGEAERAHFRLRLDAAALEKADFFVNAGRAPQYRRIVNLVGTSRFEPYAYLYGKYDDDPDVQHLFQRDRLTHSKFREVDVVKLVKSAIQGPLDDFPRGADLALDKLVATGVLKRCFPLHNAPELAVLHKEWFCWTNGIYSAPLDRIRAYMGEKLALFTAFSCHYTEFLICPAVLGIAVFVHQRATGRLSVVSLPIYGVFMAIWATAMLEFWKRREVLLAKLWGMSDFEQLEVTRPEFNNHPKVKQVPSPETGLPVPYFSTRLRSTYLSISWAVILVMVGIVLLCVVSIFGLRVVMIRAEGGILPTGSGSIIAALINAVQIQVLNLLYGKVAKALNDMENHPTQTMYEDQLIAKTFCFQFINSYFSLFWIAFVKNHVTLFGEAQHCVTSALGEPDCLAELADQLGVIFVSRLVVGNFMEVVMPVIKGRCARKIKGLRQRMEDGGDQASNSDEVDVGPFAQAERESSLEEYDSFDDWAETLIQFGYVSLFVVAFPLAPLLAFVNNYAELRVDAYKATTATRADPDGAQDVGTWFRWLTVMGYACVITNVATLCFSATSNAFAVDFATREKVWTFLILEHAIFAIKYVIAWAVPDVPEDVTLQLKRQEYLTLKLLQFVKDDDDDLEGAMEAKAQADSGGGDAKPVPSTPRKPSWAAARLRRNAKK